MTSTGTPTPTAASIIGMRRGKIVSRKVMVSGSMIIRSTKFAVVQITLYLNSETWIRATTMTSESAPAMPVKTGMMLGLGETREEILRVILGSPTTRMAA